MLDGFFPAVDADARPRRQRGSGSASSACRSPPTPRSRGTSPTSWPASARPRAEETRPLVRPDAILFNGGALEPEVVRERIARRDRRLARARRRLAPRGARGRVAPARGRARRGVLRARAPRRSACASAAARRAPTTSASAATTRGRSASCRAAWRRARRSTIAGHDFELLANRPVAFPLFTATDRSGERGRRRRRAPRARSRPLPPIRTVLRFGRKLEERALPVQLEVRLTEIGTLELWCRSRTTEHRWRLEFRLRDTVGRGAGAARRRRWSSSPARVEEATALLRGAFEGDDDPVTLARRLEAALDAGRDAWPLAAIRALWDALWPLEPARARSPEHEARWLNLAGFLLRPGFGDPGDDLRVEPALARPRRRPAPSARRSSAAPSGGTSGSASRAG